MSTRLFDEPRTIFYDKYSDKPEGPLRILCRGPTKQERCGNEATRKVQYSMWNDGPMATFDFCDECYGLTFGEESTRKIRIEQKL